MQSLISVLSPKVAAPPYDMRTIRTTAMILSSAKKVSGSRHTKKKKRTRADGVIVCVSDALVEEVKRIIKDSEILKYALGLPDKKNTGADLI
jgi:hypothetical protein